MLSLPCTVYDRILLCLFLVFLTLFWAFLSFQIHPSRNTAFLIQNMCPAIEKYLVPYIDKNRQPIRIDDRIAADIKKNAREVLAIARRGSKVIFPDVFQIYRGLEEQLRQAQRDRLPPSSAQEKTSILEQLHQLEQVQPSSNRKKSPKRQDQER